MRIAMAFMALVFVLGLRSTVVKTRRGRWWDAAAVLLPVLGIDLTILGDLRWGNRPLLWAGCVLALAGFGAEGYSYWRARALKREQAGQ